MPTKLGKIKNLQIQVQVTGVDVREVPPVLRVLPLKF